MAAAVAVLGAALGAALVGPPPAPATARRLRSWLGTHATQLAGCAR
ncbi:hypothetical protein ACIBAG_11140 [Streptomyces sp. NPDC051243]